MKLAHIINPVLVPPSSDLFVAQPVTFETMQIAKDFAQADIDVSLFTAQFPEDRPMIPDGFTPTPDLDRSVLDVATFKKKRKLPLLRDILDRLYEAAPDADYLAYTNVDIALMPFFYRSVKQYIQTPLDAIVINRRTISNEYTGCEQIPLMYADLGEVHGGFDCFIFKRASYPRYTLGDTCIGAGGVGSVLLSNMACHAENFKVFTDQHLTFHIGKELAWKNPEFADFTSHNLGVMSDILKHLQKESGPFKHGSLPASLVSSLEPGLHSRLKYRIKRVLSIVNRSVPKGGIKE